MTTSTIHFYKYLIYSTIFFGFVLRVVGIGHDIGFHPDERHIILTVERLSWADANPGSFAYGSLVFYFLWLTSELFEATTSYSLGMQDLYLLGRVVAISCFVITALLLEKITWRLTGSRLASWSATLLLSLNPFHIQLSHFYTTDILLSVAVTAFFVVLSGIRGLPRKRDIALLSLIIGCSLAIKISSSTLFLPLAVILIKSASTKKQLVRQLLYSLLAATVVFLLCEPYALIDPVVVARDLVSELAMVSGSVHRPYTLQYLGMPPYIPHLKTMWHYTLGWPVLLASLLGLGWFCLQQRRSLPVQGLALWCFFFFLALGRYPVSFPRYLLPLYPFLFLGVGYLVVRISSEGSSAAQVVGKVVTTILFGYALWSGLSQSSLYFSPHPWHTASRWMYQNLPDEAIILSPSWDDTLPINLPHQPQNKAFRKGDKDTVLELYLPPSSQALRDLSSQLSKGTYVAFPSTRLIRAAAQAPEEIPLARSFLSLLFAGKLGFSPEVSFDSIPSFAHLSRNDLLGDESLSVYDHPQVLLFRRVKSLSQREIEDKLKEGLLESSPPDLARYRDMVSRVNHTSLPQFPYTEVVVWSLLLMVLWLATFPLTVHLFPNNSGVQSFIALPLGFFLITSFIWVAYRSGLVSLSQYGAWFTFIVATVSVLLTGFVARGKKGALVPQFEQAATVGLLVFNSGLLLLIFRLCNPEIVWGEKPMDFSFLNYFILHEKSPPHDPWIAGAEVSYHYGGYFAYALLHKLTGLPSAVGYNVSLITSGILLVLAVAAALSISTKNILFAGVAALLALVMNNGEALRLFLFSATPLGFDLFWKSTRSYATPGFSEFPLWSYLFGDLHPHLLSAPLGLLLIVNTLCPLGTSQTQRISRGVCGGILLGVLTLWNVWDVPLYAGLIISTMALLFIAHRSSGTTLRTSRTLLFSPALSLVVGALLSYLIFTSLKKTQTFEAGIVRDAEKNTLLHVISAHGTLLLLCLSGTLALLVSRHSRTSKVAVPCALLFGLAPFLLIFSTSFVTGEASHYDLALGVSVLLISAVLAGLRDEPYPEHQTPYILMVCAGFLILLSELFFAVDRMNTVFKVNTTVWLWLFMSSLMIFSPKSTSLHQRHPVLSLVKNSGCWMLAIYIGASAVILLASLARFRRVDGHRPTLNGTQFISQQTPSLERALSVVSRLSVKDVIAQAPLPAYEPTLFLTTYTGIPAYLGWPSHVQQRGISRSELLRRQRILRVIYQGRSAEVAHRAATLEGITIIAVSQFEKALYGEEGIEKFKNHPSLFKEIVKIDTIEVFEVQEAS